MNTTCHNPLHEPCSHIAQLVKSQREYFSSLQTKEVRFRIDTLKKLSSWIQTHENEIAAALKADLRKAPMESYMSEIGMVLSELRYQIKHIKKWAKKHYVMTPLAQFYGRSFISYEPYGVVLIMAPWNYPFLLCLEPAIGAIAAGNCVIIKPSAYAPATSALIAKMIDTCFVTQHVSVVEGGRQENNELLEQRFDYIFFTGSAAVGHMVMEKASRHLTPVTLELGGKSPCLIEESADLPLAVKRIAFGKFLNAGQTCVAPDYLLIPANLKGHFIELMRKTVQEFFGDVALRNKDLPQIINEKHFQRLVNLLAEQNIVLGGEIDPDQRLIAPTIVDDVDEQNPLMQQEIFGPILPIITYDDLDSALACINAQEKPLALYLFTTNRKIEEHVLRTCSFGGGCINDTIIHLASSRLGFGGVGGSGMGSYHGYESFQTFSHRRSIVKKANWLDLPFRYHPYTEKKGKILKKFLK